MSEEDHEVFEKALFPNNRDIITRKARTILYLAEGGKVKEAAAAFRLSTKTIYSYVKQFLEEGAEDYLTVKPRPGRPPRTPANIGEIICDALKRSPAAIECMDTAAHNWTLELMREYLEKAHGVFITIKRVWQLQQKFGIRHIYSKAITTSPDPQYTEKRNAIEALKKGWRPVSCRRKKKFSSPMK